MSQTLYIENPLIRTYCYHVGILAVKMLLMSLLTGGKRIFYLALINPEDASVAAAMFGDKKKLIRNDERVERVRRAHLNDLENIPIFLVVSLVYIFTNPPQALASTLFLAFTISRILHTFVYAVIVIPQPARVLTWGVAYVITLYMAIESIRYFAV